MNNLSLIVVFFTLVCAVIFIIFALRVKTRPFRSARFNAERKAQRAEKKAKNASVKAKKALTKAANPEAEAAKAASKAWWADFNAGRIKAEEEDRKADKERKDLAEAIAKALRKGLK